MDGLGEEALGEWFIETEASELADGVVAERDSLHDAVEVDHPVVQPLLLRVRVMRRQGGGARRPLEDIHLVQLLAVGGIAAVDLAVAGVGGTAEEGGEEDGVVQDPGYSLQSVVLGVTSSHEIFQTLESERDVIFLLRGTIFSQSQNCT